MISVIIPVYNAEKYIEKCLDSLMLQSFKDLEILLIDDGSTDCSSAICDRYAATDERIRVIHQENAGVGAARNRGLELAAGEYVSFVDSDDWLEFDMYENIYSCIQKEQPDIVICDALFHLPGGKTQVRTAGPDIGLMDAHKFLYNYFVKDSYGRGLWNKIFSRKILKDVRFDPDIHYYEDSLFLTKAAVRAERIEYLPKILYHYLFGHETNSAGNYQKYKTSVAAAERIEKLLEKTFPDLKDAGTCKISFMAINTARKAFKNGIQKEGKYYQEIARKAFNIVKKSSVVTKQQKFVLKLSILSPVKGVDLWLKLKNQ